MHEHSYLDSHGHRRMFRPDNLADYLPDDSPGPDELLALAEEATLGLDQSEALRSFKSSDPVAVEAVAAFLRWCVPVTRNRLNHPARTACLRFLVAVLTVEPGLLPDDCLTSIARVLGVSKAASSLHHRRISDELGGVRRHDGRTEETREVYAARQRRIWRERKEKTKP